MAPFKNARSTAQMGKHDKKKPSADQADEADDVPPDGAPPDDAPAVDERPTNAQRSASADASCAPPSVSTVPPSSGPDHGASTSTTSETSSYCTPADVCSRPFVLTSTEATPAADAVVLHVSADSLTYAAATTVAFRRQRSAPSASADDEKPLPSTVSGVPPSDAPLNGHTDDTAANGRYVNVALLGAYC